MNDDYPMNKNAVCSELEECRQAITILIDEIKAGEKDGDSSVVLSIDFVHILNHLCCAWHSRSLDDRWVNRLNSEEFKLIRDSVPNWNSSLRLVDPDGDLIAELLKSRASNNDSRLSG